MRPRLSPRPSDSVCNWLGKFSVILACSFFALVLISPSHADSPQESLGKVLNTDDCWSGWRGPHGTGLAAASANPPSHWTADWGVRWKVPLPGPGNSSPIVVANHVFITQFDPKSRERLLLCFSADTGIERWRYAEIVNQDEWTYPGNPLCASSPASNGKVVAAFLGQAGVVCCDIADGKLLWKRELGAPQHLFGGGPSVVFVGDSLVVTFGPGKEQFYSSFDVATGAEKWRLEMPRVNEANPLEGPDAPQLPEGTDMRDPFGSWATPLPLFLPERTELILAMPGELRAVDPRNGDKLWGVAVPRAQIIASPTYGSDLVVMQCGTAFAVQPGRNGEVPEADLQWHLKNDPERIASPLIVDDYLFGLTMNSVVDCRDVGTGEVLWKERLSHGGSAGSSWGSLVAAGERVFALTQSGTTYVFAAAVPFRLLSVNPLGETTNATPAICGDAIYIRTDQHLWCLSEGEI